MIRGLLPDLHSARIRNRFAFQWTVRCQGVCPHGRADMLRADLMKRDLLSEIVLVGSGVAIVILLVWIVVISLTRVQPYIL